ncbi:MAG: ImmA/IrrE family metallo-endopeptidase [Giesbergeria sp.]|uniref:ImmA/IrrE family metallo-endopeptidase n=1 Tax=Giesbergeria sp. TaxID=2818473 RepID=UPI00263A186F|nr:ImmA/IrrE family metallo-endopeptidase [Giesbergeria sp.]MDD2609313.1 ImmA/IrrE family metallo-endopeptidase [Giesbergeria sp.]
MVMLAEGILKRHWNQSVPVDVARIAQGMGVALDYSDSLSVCAHLQVSLQNQPRLTLCQQHSLALQRYATAQALGHVALHHLRPGLERHIVVTEDFVVDENSRTEREAHQFALRLLMPEAVLRYCVQEMALQDLLELADIFDVPATLMGWRLLHWPAPSSA